MNVKRRETIFIQATKDQFAALADQIKADDFSSYRYHDTTTGLDVTFEVSPRQPSEEERTSSGVANGRLPVDVGEVSEVQFYDIRAVLEHLQNDSRLNDDAHQPNLEPFVRRILERLGLEYNAEEED